MPILKHVKKIGYVQISNSLAQNTNISYEALGVLVNLLSRPEDWVVRKSFFRNKKCGEIMLNRIFKELQEAKYLKLVEERVNGRIDKRIWLVSDEPMSSSENDIKTLGSPNTGKPQVEVSSSWENQELQIKSNTNKEESLQNKEKEKNSSSADERVIQLCYHPDMKEFGRFWEAYPRKQNRRAAERSWKAKKADALIDIILGDIRFRKANAQPNGWIDKKTGAMVDGSYIQLPSTYLNQERWDDEYCEVSQ